MFDDFDMLLEEELKNPDLKKEWGALEPEFNIIQAMICARKNSHLTQKELAQRTGIHQADISKLETGNANPTLLILQRLAQGMDMQLKFELIPKQKTSMNNGTQQDGSTQINRDYFEVDLPPLSKRRYREP